MRFKPSTYFTFFIKPSMSCRIMELTVYISANKLKPNSEILIVFMVDAANGNLGIRDYCTCLIVSEIPTIMNNNDFIDVMQGL